MIPPLSELFSLRKEYTNKVLLGVGLLEVIARGQRKSTTGINKHSWGSLIQGMAVHWHGVWSFYSSSVFLVCTLNHDTFPVVEAFVSVAIQCNKKIHVHNNNVCLVTSRRNVHITLPSTPLCDGGIFWIQEGNITHNWQPCYTYERAAQE